MLVDVGARGNVLEFARVSEFLDGGFIHGQVTKRRCIFRKLSQGASREVIGMRRAKDENSLRLAKVEGFVCPSRTGS